METTRPPSIALLCTLATLLSGCGALFGGIEGHRHRDVPEVPVVGEDAARKLVGQWVDLQVPFDADEDTTAAMLAFLQRARDAGAKAVTDVEIQVVVSDPVAPSLCRTPVTPRGRPERVRDVVTRPARFEHRSEMTPVTRMVTENRYECQLVSKPVSRYETQYQYQYDPMSRSSRSVPVSRHVTRSELQNECAFRPVTRMVTRYEWQTRSRYIPPQWDVILRTHVEWDLTEGEPSCETLPVGAAARSRVTGRVLMRGRPQETR